MQKLILPLLLGVALVGCQSADTAKTGGPTKPAASESADVAPGIQTAKAEDVQSETPASTKEGVVDAPPRASQVTFFDSYSFDVDLSGEFRKETQEVTIGTIFSINDIPPRLDQWFSRVKKSGGDVKAIVIPKGQDAPTRGIFGEVFDVAVKVSEAAEREAIFGPADNYDALLHYREDSGDVDKVVFIRRVE